ncbi:MAG: OmpH family outer membrane protein [bacterium]
MFRKNVTLIIGTIAIIFLPSLLTQAKDLKLAYVTMEEILNNYSVYLQEADRIQKEMAEKEKEIQAKLDEYQKRLDELQGKMLNPMLSEDTRKKAGDEYTAVLNEAFQYRDQALAGLDTWSQQQLQPTYEKVYQEIANIAIKEGYSFVFNESTSVIYGDDVYNITKMIIDSLNAKASEGGPK